MKKHLALLLLLSGTLLISGCTSGDSESTEDGAVADESLESAESGDTAGLADESADGFSDEVGGDQAAAGDAPLAPPGEEIALDAEAGSADAAAATDIPPADGGGDLPPPMDAPPESDAGLSPEPSPADMAGPPPVEELPPDSEPPPAEPAPEPVSTAGVDPGSEIFEEKPKPAPMPVQKIEAAPFRREGILLNAVYLARPGDNFSKVARKIYGDSKRSKELRNANPNVMPKVGDKIYYNSPQRPDDETTLKVFYEDIGMSPETYVTQEGDNLRTLSKKLLGHDGAWKEVYAINTVDSTRKVPAGVELRFWRGADAPPAEAAAPPPVDVAVNTEASMPEVAPPPPDMAPPPAEMPPMDAAAAPVDDLNSPPPPPTDAPPPDMMASEPPPPPMEQEMAPPPPPPAPEMAPPPPPPVARVNPDLQMAGGEDDMMLALAGGGGVLALLAALMVMRKRRQQREMASAFGDTQVGT